MRKINLVVGRYDSIRSVALSLKKPLYVPLEQQLAIIPLAGSVLAEIEEKYPHVPHQAQPHWFPAYSYPVDMWLRERSHTLTLAHTYINTINDNVSQVASLWKNGKLVLAAALNDIELMLEIDPVNTVLRHLGAHPKWWMDEMQSVGINRHPSMEEWLNDAEHLYQSELSRLQVDIIPEE